MSNKENLLLVPKLRFSAFKDAGGWIPKRLGNEGSFLSSLSGKAGGDFDSGDAKFVTYMNVFSNTFVDSKALRFVDVKEGEIQNKVFRGDVFFTISSETPEDVGMSSVLLEEIDNCYLNSFCTLFRFTESTRPNSVFIGYLLRQPLVRGYFAKKGQGSTRFNLSKDAFKNLPIVLPSSPEQQKIADCLSSLDELIAAQARKVDALKTHKKGLMQQLFPREGENQPRFRFYDFNEARDWSEKPFGDLLDDILDFRGRTPKKLGMEWGGGEIAILSANNVKNGFIDYSSECNVGSEELYEKWMGGVNLERGDIVFTMEAPLGKATLLPDSEKYILSQRVVAFKTCAEVSNEFLIQVIWSEEFQKGISQLATGSTAKGINQKALKTVRLKLPCSKEQERIAGCLTSIDAFITAATKELKVLITHKGGLMQQLFPSAEAGEA